MWRDKKNSEGENHDSGSYNYKMFKFYNRKFKINEVEPSEDVKHAFQTYADGDTSMSAIQLRRFLVQHQGETTGVADAQQYIEEVIKRRHHITRYTRHGLDLDDFFHFLFFDDLNPPINTAVHQDMDAPLSHYYIYTGHNSYLTGNQLSSDCSEVPIIKALIKGVRVIELDLWPNSTRDDVHVLHGRTLTTPVPLIKCLKSIRDYAFVTSPYPVIITLEDHLTPELQAKVAEMATQTFGDTLYYPESDHLSEFPTPESLKHRLMISTKPPKEYLEGSNMPKHKSDSYDDSEGADLDAESEYKLSDGEQEEEEFSEEQKLGAQQYKRLITIHAQKPNGAVRDSLEISFDKVKRLSLSEQALEKTCSVHGDEIVKFTQRNLIRVYPKGTRFDSSNYDPLIGWTHGAQMVAFNMQGYGRSLCLMQGMFRANGGCGYVKKPDFLTKNGLDGEIFDPKQKMDVKTTLKVKVYMGDGWRLDFSHTHFDSYSPPDFYTKVQIYGVEADNAKKKTKVIEDDWYPVWDEEFVFPLTVPEIALLRIEVREYDMSEKDDFGGQTCLPVWEIKSGIRSVPLFDKKGEKLRSVRLLIKFQFD